MEIHVVTGGGGFVGRYLVEYLLKNKPNVKVRIFDLRKTWEDSRVEYITGDLTSKDQVTEAFKGATVVYHVAAAPFGATANLEKINVDGTAIVIEACRRNGVKKLIYTSSSSVVFTGDDLKYVDEETPYPKKHVDAYNETKAKAEQMVLEANGKDGLMTCAIRPAGIFGPGDNYGVPQFIKVGMTKKSRFAQLGDGSNMFDFTYVENVAHAHSLAADKLSPGSQVGGQAFFITNDEPIKFWDWPKMIWKELGYPLPIMYIPRWIILYLFIGIDMILRILYPILNKTPKMTQIAINATSTKTFNISKSKKLLGYHPIVNLSDAQSLTINHYKNLIQSGKFNY